MFEIFPTFNKNFFLIIVAITHLLSPYVVTDEVITVREVNGDELVDKVRQTFADILNNAEGTEVSRAVLMDTMDVLRHPVAGKTVEGILHTIVRMMKHRNGHDSLIAFSDSVSDIFTSDQASPAFTKFIAGTEIVLTKEKLPSVLHVLFDIEANLISAPRAKESIKAVGRGTIDIIDEPDSPAAIRQSFVNLKRLITEKMTTKIVKNARSFFSRSKNR